MHIVCALPTFKALVWLPLSLAQALPAWGPGSTAVITC